ncbi:MAG: MmgE/PrpD family protein [Rhodospirillales bacterium]|nr:MmgE/PrpD family protein [Rhodospirillales bacterium]MBO6785213.1 MmgE/PrpD family protein [Rhodospirillales bacterium]
MKNDSRAGASRVMAEFTSALTFERVPGQVIAHLKLSVLDGIACCLVGAGLPWTRKVADMIAGEGGVPAATVIGARRSFPLSGAVLVNATAGHAFELDDIHRDAILHPNSIAVPVALNTAEYLGGASGRDVLTAIVAGYEAGNRIGAAAGTDLLLRGFHPQGVIGPFTAAATAARLMNLSADETLNAMGIAGSLGAGLMAAQEGAMVKRLHSGNAAEAGVRGALLARDGFTGISDVVEADYGGFLAAFSGKIELDRVTGGLGDIWETAATGFKPHATVTSIHAALDALSAIREKHGLKPADIAAIRAGVSNPTYVHCAWPYEAQSITAAQMNIYYGLAMIAFHGRAFTEQFTDDAIREPEVLAFINRISAEVDPEIEARGPAFRHMARVRVTTTDGRTFEETVTHRKGSPDNPLSPDEVEAKYMALAGGVLGADKAQAVRDMVFALDRADEVESLTYAISGN